MWMQDTYEGHTGKWWSLPPRKVLPKPWKKPHPAMWYAAGNTTSYAMAARKGLGVLGFSVGNIEELEPVLTAYKKEIVNAEPVGAFVNDNVMVTSAAFVTNDHDSAVRSAVNSRMNYLQSNVFRYHDTFPTPPGIPPWPELIPDYTLDNVNAAIAMGSTICGDPDEALAQCQRWADAGLDQLVFGIGTASLDDTLDTIRLLGEYVIPKVGTDPVHSTTRYRDAARS
jgi:alkanesulfonate monooxygenase SsuD/methylene tetrahydromethanopterin reductase-like flavin-dependent oxidoreductase (luciferase family)